MVSIIMILLANNLFIKNIFINVLAPNNNKKKLVHSDMNKIY